MANELDATESTYRVVDAVYRLHHDLFQIENILARTARMQLRLAQMTINGRSGTMVAGLLVIVPILVALGDIKWGSVPAITIYLLAGAVAVLWIYQIISAARVGKELTVLEGYTSTEALEDRMDFVLEEVNAWVVRHRLIDRILRQLRAVMAITAEDSTRLDLIDRQKRYEEILRSCEDYVTSLIDVSAKLVAVGKRSKEDHDELVDWAAAIPRFATRDRTPLP